MNNKYLTINIGKFYINIIARIKIQITISNNDYIDVIQKIGEVDDKTKAMGSNMWYFRFVYV